MTTEEKLIRSRRIRNLLRTFFVLGALISVLGAVQALLPSRAVGELADGRLTGHAATASNSCPAEQQLRGVGVAHGAAGDSITVLLGAAPRNGVLTLHFAGSTPAVTLTQSTTDVTKWTASTNSAAGIAMGSVGVAVDGAHIVIGMPAGVSVSGVAVNTAADRLPASGFVAPSQTPTTGFTLLDAGIVVVLLLALCSGWRQRLVRETGKTVAALLALAGTLALFPVVSVLLGHAAASNQLITALIYGLLLAAICLGAMLVSRLISPHLRFTESTPAWIRRVDAPLAAALSGLRATAVIAMVLALASSLSMFNFAQDSMERSAAGQTLIAKWDAFFPVTTFTPPAAPPAPDKLAAVASSCASLPDGTLPSRDAFLNVMSVKALRAADPRTGATNVPELVMLTASAPPALTAPGDAFSFVVVIARPGVANGTGPYAIDHAGSIQLWLSSDGTGVMVHKAVRAWDGQKWTWRVDADAADLTFESGSRGVAFLWTGLRVHDAYGVVTASDRVCTATALDAAGNPVLVF